MPGIPSWVHHADHGEPGHGTRRAGLTRVTALRRTVAEQTVTDARVTVTRFTVGLYFSHHPFHCWVRKLPPYRPVWEREGMLRRVGLFPLTRFTVGSLFSALLFPHFLLPFALQQGLYPRGVTPPTIPVSLSGV